MYYINSIVSIGILRLLFLNLKKHLKVHFISDFKTQLLEQVSGFVTQPHDQSWAFEVFFQQ